MESRLQPTAPARTPQSDVQLGSRRRRILFNLLLFELLALVAAIIPATTANSSDHAFVFGHFGAMTVLALPTVVVYAAIVEAAGRALATPRARRLLAIAASPLACASSLPSIWLLIFNGSAPDTWQAAMLGAAVVLGATCRVPGQAVSRQASRNAAIALAVGVLLAFMQGFFLV